MVTSQFLSILADVRIDHLHSLIWRSEMECTNALYMHDLIAPLTPLYRVKFGEDWSSSLDGEQANRWKLRCSSA